MLWTAPERAKASQKGTSHERSMADRHRDACSLCAPAGKSCIDGWSASLSWPSWTSHIKVMYRSRALTPFPRPSYSGHQNSHKPSQLTSNAGNAAALAGCLNPAGIHGAWVGVWVGVLATPCECVQKLSDCNDVIHLLLELYLGCAQHCIHSIVIFTARRMRSTS